MLNRFSNEIELRNHEVHRNQQYSILAISNASGAVVERVAYQAYGQPTFTNAAGTTLSSSAKATRYSYTGREWDQSLELHHFRARWMSEVSGRFLGRDPIGMIDGPDNYLLYFSMHNVDPSGLWTVDISDKEKNDLKDCNCGIAKVRDKEKADGSAWVECDGEGDFKVVVGPIVNQPEGDRDCITKCGLGDCFTKHEEHHIEQYRRFCPNACDGGCKPHPTGVRVGFEEGSKCYKISECYGNQTEFSCLNAKKKVFEKVPARTRTKCNFNGRPGTTCDTYIVDYIKRKRPQVETEYNCKNLDVKLIK